MNRFVKLTIVSIPAIISVIFIIAYQQQIDQSLGHPNAANYLTLLVLVIEIGFIFLEIGQTKLPKIGREETFALGTHCQILISEFQTHDKTVYTGQTLGEHFSKFKYGIYLIQHFQTGHPEIYEPLQPAIQSHKTLRELEANGNYNLYELRLKELLRGIELKTRTLGGACDECLKYHDRKRRKQYEKILHPES